MGRGHGCWIHVQRGHDHWIRVARGAHDRFSVREGRHYWICMRERRRNQIHMGKGLCYRIHMGRDAYGRIRMGRGVDATFPLGGRARLEVLVGVGRDVPHQDGKGGREGKGRWSDGALARSVRVASARGATR